MQNTQENKAKEMLIENATMTDTTTYRIKKTSIDYGVNFTVSGDSTNCKLSYIHGIGSLKGNFKEEEYKAVIDTLLYRCKGTVLLNTIVKEVATFIKENYTHYYYQEVPIGYGNGYQYHILIRNDINPNRNCRNPEVKNPITSDFKASIKTKLLETLKKLRRKDDYVDQFVNSL